MRHDDIGEDGEHSDVSLCVLVDQMDLQVGVIAVDDVLAGRMDVPLQQLVAVIADNEGSAAVYRLERLHHVAGVFYDQRRARIVDAQCRQLRLRRRGDSDG